MWQKYDKYGNMFTNGTTMGQKYDKCGNVFPNVTQIWHMGQKCKTVITKCVNNVAKIWQILHYVYQCDTGNQLDEEATEPDEKMAK